MIRLKAIDIQNFLEAQILCGPLPDEEIMTACGSDMMSDVLAFPKEKMVLLTGLTNPHTVRTSELLDVGLIVFVRGKVPSKEVIEMAEEAGIAVLVTKYTLYDSCGRLYQAGLLGGTGRKV